jgi:hypothetical protein
MILITFILMIALLSACTEDVNTHRGNIEITINNLSDLVAMNEKLGSDYDAAKFVLTTDITVNANDNWIPIGKSVDNSFMSQFDGNGHTITLNFATEEASGLDSFGLFGYIKNAVISNINLNINFDFKTDKESTYVGGLVGFALGSNQFTNVEINGSISHQSPIHPIISPSGYITYPPQDKNTFVGGILGYGVGDFKFTDIKSDVSIDLPALRGDDLRYYGFLRAYTGGVIGYLRTTDISETNSIIKERNKLDEIDVSPDLDIEGEYVFAGGVAGIIYNADISDVQVEDETLAAGGNVHTYAGGAFALADNCAISKIKVVIDVRVEPSSGKKAAESFGGIAGYFNNGVTLTDAEYNGKIYTQVSADSQSYAGGIVGTMSNSTITDTIVGKVGDGFVVSGYTTAASFYYNIVVNNTLMIANYGGVAGRIHGESKIEDTDVKFIAYQGVVSEIAMSIDVISDENGEPVKVETKANPEISDDVVYYKGNVGAIVYNQNVVTESQRSKKFAWLSDVGHMVDE